MSASDNGVATELTKETPEDLLQEIPGDDIVYSSLRQCSGATGIPYDVLTHAKANGAPGFIGHRVRWAELKPWLDSHLEDVKQDDPTQDRRYWSVYKEKFDALRSEQAYNKEKGLVISKEDVAAQLIKIAIATKSLLRTKLEDEAPPKLVGLSANEIRAFNAKLVDEICKVIQEGLCK